MALVLWSGGCDSTLVLWRLLQDQSKSSGPIKTLAVSHVQIAGAKEHSKARQTILKELRRRGYRVEHTDIAITHTGLLDVHGHNGIPQAALWLSQAVLYADATEDIYAGYVRGDDAWHYKDNIWGAFGWLMRIVGKTGNLLCPLEWTYKSEVIAELKQAKLLQLAWWCETPKDGRPCRECSSCVTHALAVRRIQMTNRGQP